MAPYLLEQLVAGDGLAAVLDQIPEKLELPAGQVYVFAIVGEQLPADVQEDVANANPMGPRAT